MCFDIIATFILIYLVWKLFSFFLFGPERWYEELMKMKEKERAEARAETKARAEAEARVYGNMVNDHLDDIWESRSAAIARGGLHVSH